MRYNRQIILPEIGKEGQAKLKAAKVLIVGVGGLGSPIALYLAGAGVGTLGLVDDDEVSISNLQRQVLYTEDELGDFKAVCAAMRLTALNSEIMLDCHVRKSIVHSLPAKTSPKPQIIFKTSVASTLPVMAGVTPITPLGGGGIRSISSSLGYKSRYVFFVLP